MHDLITRGKVLYWGTSEWSAEQLSEAYAICERDHLYKPQAEQPRYSMLARERVEQEILPVTEPHGTGLVCFSPLGQGMLTGKYDDGIPAGTRFAREDWAARQYVNQANREKVRALQPIAEGLGINRAQLALAWVLRQPGVSSVIIGATKPEQVTENAGASEVALSAETLAEIERILA
jgi:aryl-alcohol dehydrogenase-like predicted oxidoreductase